MNRKDFKPGFDPLLDEKISISKNEDQKGGVSWVTTTMVTNSLF